MRSHRLSAHFPSVLAAGGASCALLLLLSVSRVSAQDPPVDPPADPVLLYGSGALTPPEGAADQDASGAVRLKQRNERNALHIHVKGLEPGATYDVRAASGDTSESIGSITTHDGTPPPPSCFSAKLSAPAPEGDPAAGDGAGGHHRIEWHDWLPRPPSGPTGFALLHVNKDRTQIAYWVGVRGLGDVTASTLAIGDASLALDVSGMGAVDVTEEQIAALVAGGGSLTVVGTGDPAPSVSGPVAVCFEGLRERMAARRAGRGALRIDTASGDALPLGAETIADLVGVVFSVVDGEGNVVLAGSVAELREPWTHRNHDGAGGGGAIGDDLADSYFHLDEIHDAGFIRGDANESGSVDLADAISLLFHLFGGAAGPRCEDAADANDDGSLGLEDSIFILQFLFRGEAPLPTPFPERGFDSTPDELFCAPYSI